MNLSFIENLANQLRQLAMTTGISAMAYNAIDVSRIREDILTVAKEVEIAEPQVSSLLIHAKNNLFFSNQIGQAVLNPYMLGEIIFGLDFLVSKYDVANKPSAQDNDIWSYIHPMIQKSSKLLYNNGHYANAAEDAFIEINDRTKKLFSIIKPKEAVPDGETAMTTVFSTKDPLVEFCDRNTESGKNKQKGYMMMLAGAIDALRNPKAHSNTEALSAKEAYRRLATASMLMYAIDDAVQYTKVDETCE